MRFVFALLIGLMPICLHAQVFVGDSIPTAEELSEAQRKMEASKPKLLKLGVGVSQVLLPADAIKGLPLTWDPSDLECIDIIWIDAGESHSMRGLLVGDTVPTLHKFAAKPYPWCIVTGRKKGSSTVNIWRNGDMVKVKGDGVDPAKIPAAPAPAATTQGPPVKAGQVLITVDGGAPIPPKPDDPVDPPTPVETQLTKDIRAAIAADRGAGKADDKWVRELTGVYDKASKLDMSKVTTVVQLDTILNNARLATGMPEYDVMLTSLRTLIRNEMYKALGAKVDDRTAIISPDAMRLAQAKFADIAKSLAIVVP